MEAWWKIGHSVDLFQWGGTNFPCATLWFLNAYESRILVARMYSVYSATTIEPSQASEATSEGHREDSENRHQDK
jgi:hypothetical protein